MSKGCSRRIDGTLGDFVRRSLVDLWPVGMAIGRAGFGDWCGRDIACCA